MKIAVLSNVNVDFVAKQLAKNYEVCPAEGYGDILGKMLNPTSALNVFAPQVICIVVDIRQLLDGIIDVEEMYHIIDEWFDMLQQIRNTQTTYFVSDVKFRGNFVADGDEFVQLDMEMYWMNKLKVLVKNNTNVHILHLGRLIEKNGSEHFYSNKTWYLGKIPYSMDGNKMISQEINKRISHLFSVSKKVLVLDLDHTLWGGIIGEVGVDGITLSDEKVGAVYRDCQILLKQMQKRGVLLAICSKNNPEDVEGVWQHPHMILSKEDFVASRINWEDKSANIRQMAKELNLGTDSFVFVDDMPNEREGVRSQLPEVVVPEFPNMIEQLPEFYQEIYENYFSKANVTEEDKVKTQQYMENSKREKAKEGVDFQTFLASLELRPVRVEWSEAVKARVVQLIGKTNQFNLTTIRYTEADIEKMRKDGWFIYAYRVSDKFGDYGIVAVLLVEPTKGCIDTFLMSCRIMGKELEKYFIEQVENDLLKNGYQEVYARYIPTAKNKPTEYFYESVGYEVWKEHNGYKEYKIELKNRPQRGYYVMQEET